MFTGIVEELGRVLETDPAGPAEPAGPAGYGRLRIRAPAVAADARHGDSIAVNGVCLTAAEVADGQFTADVMAETLARSGLGALRPGSPVNLERPLTLASRLGGHLVQGHVDGVGTVVERDQDPHAALVRVALPGGLSRYLVEKGSVTVDGVSLTVVEAGRDTFTVSLIPTTLELTTLGSSQPGDPVNLEVDVVAKYVERLMEARS